MSSIDPIVGETVINGVTYKITTTITPQGQPPPPPPPDRELKIVQVKSSNDDGNVAENVLDATPSRWSSNQIPAILDCFVGCKPNEQQKISEVKIQFFRGNERSSNFDLAVSTDGGASFTNIMNGRQEGGMNVTIDIEPDVRAGIFRYIGKGNTINSWTSIEHIQLFGQQLVDVTGPCTGPPPPPPEECPPGTHKDPTTGECVPNGPPPPPPPPGGATGTVAPGVIVPLTFAAEPGNVGMHPTAEVFGDDTRQEGEIHAGGAHVEGVYCAYHTHSGVGDDQYSWKFGFGGDGGEYEQIIKMGGKQEAGGRWESNHNNYSDVPDPEKVSVLPGMSGRINNGLVTGMDNKEQGFQVVKTRSPNNDANVYDIFVDDRDGQGWKYAFTKLFGDDDYDQQGRGYDDDAFRLEIRYQDMDGTVDYSDLNYKEGRVSGYISPLIGGSTPPPPPPGQLGPYQSTGNQIDCDIDDEAGIRHYASGKDDDRTIEAEADGIAFSNYQFVVDVTMHEVEHDDQVSLKYGGTHTGTGWFDNTVSFLEGECCLGKEEDHPSTDLCVETGPSIGNILEKRLKVAGVYFKERNHIELWTDFEGSGWIKQLEATDLGGFNPGADEDEATLRIDGFSEGGERPGEGNVPTIHAAFVQEIVATSTSRVTSLTHGKSKTVECDCDHD